MLLAVFRADASQKTGGGHVMRCQTLANAIAEQGWTCAFATRHESLNTIPSLNGSGHKILVLHERQLTDTDTLKYHWPSGVDLLVVDHYELDAEYESTCRSWARQIMVIDDLANRTHDADLLLDQTLGRQEQDYRSLVSDNCRLLLGTDYALLRPEFARVRKDILQYRARRKEFSRLLISLGATDPDNVTGRVMESVGASKLPLHVDVILGACAPHREAVIKQIESLPQSCKLHINPDIKTMIELMYADLAIGAAGSSAWERCCLGLPSIMLVLADNQTQNAEALAKTKGVMVTRYNFDETNNQITGFLENFAMNNSLLREMSKFAAAVCDGLGAERVTNSILNKQYRSN